MGASGWSYFVPYQNDVYQALRELREIVFERGAFYKPAEYYGKILESEVGENMSPDLRRRLKAEVEKMRTLPKPNSIDELIELNGESGTHYLHHKLRIYVWVMTLSLPSKYLILCR